MPSSTPPEPARAKDRDPKPQCNGSRVGRPRLLRQRKPRPSTNGTPARETRGRDRCFPTNTLLSFHAEARDPGIPPRSTAGTRNGEPRPHSHRHGPPSPCRGRPTDTPHRRQRREPSGRPGARNRRFPTMPQLSSLLRHIASGEPARKTQGRRGRGRQPQRRGPVQPGRTTQQSTDKPPPRPPGSGSSQQTQDIHRRQLGYLLCSLRSSRNVFPTRPSITFMI